MKSLITTFGLIFYLVFQLNAQEIRDLYYAQPKGTGLYLGLKPIENGRAVIIGLDKLYLINQEGILVDTLNLAKDQKSSFNDYVRSTAHLDLNSLSVSTNNRSLIVDVASDKFSVVEDIETKRIQQTIKKNGIKGRINYAVLLNNGMIVEMQENKNEAARFYYDFKNQKMSSNLTPPKLDVTNFRKSEVIAFNDYQFVGDTVFIWERKKNRLTIFDLRSEEKIYYEPLLANDYETELYEFYLDPFTKKKYFMYLDEKLYSKLLLFNINKMSLKLIGRFETIIRGVYKDNIYHSSYMEEVPGHYLTPIYGLNSKPKQLEEVKVNDQ